jgi:hypothetical protein
MTLRTKRIALLTSMLIIALAIFWLYELARTPYRPPHDMSSLLGGSELQIVWTLIGLLTLAWLGIFCWFVSILIRKKS